MGIQKTISVLLRMSRGADNYSAFSTNSARPLVASPTPPLYTPSHTADVRPQAQAGCGRGVSTLWNLAGATFPLRKDLLMKSTQASGRALKASTTTNLTPDEVQNLQTAHVGGSLPHKRFFQSDEGISVVIIDRSPAVVPRNAQRGYRRAG